MSSSTVHKSESHHHHDQQPFELDQVVEHFNDCANEDLDLESYLEGYEEILKFVSRLGTAFGFIVKEINEKIQILIQHLHAADKDHYVKIEEMLDYEIGLQCLTPNSYKKTPSRLYSGSRALLELQRNLYFLIQLMDSIRNSKENDRPSALAYAVYMRTLSPFHSWIMQKALHAAFLTLPERKQYLMQLQLQLITSLVGNNVKRNEANEQINQAVQAGLGVYNSVQKLYSDRKLLNLR